ncbi:Hypothetical protein, putative, partial [Bodo saltans]
RFCFSWSLFVPNKQKSPPKFWMSLPLWVFSVIERIDLRQAGNYVVPYSIILENGTIAAAYHTITEHAAGGGSNSHGGGGNSNKQHAGGMITTTSSAAAAALTTSSSSNTQHHQGGKALSSVNSSLVSHKKGGGKLNESGTSNDHHHHQQHQQPEGPAHIFRHIYDCGLQTVFHGLTIVDEAIEMEQRHTARASEIVSMLVEKVPPQESRRAQKDTNSFLAVEYLCPQHTLNVLCRGASHLYPQSHTDTEACLKEHLLETHQGNIESRPRERSGLLQRFDPMGEEFTTGVIVKWVRHEATTIIIPQTDDDRRRVSLDVECRRSKTSIKDRLAFPYQKCATVDGMKVLSVGVDPFPSSVEDAILKASAVILGEMNGEAQSVVNAVLMFRIGRQPQHSPTPPPATTPQGKSGGGGSHSKRGGGGGLVSPQSGIITSSSLVSSSTTIPAPPLVQFLYCAFAEMKTDVMVHPPLGFAIPAQYRYKKGGRPRPRSVHIYEEDLIQDVLPSAVNSPPRTRQLSPRFQPKLLSAAAKKKTAVDLNVTTGSTTGSMVGSPRSSSPRRTHNNEDDSALGLLTCVDEVMSQPKYMTLPRGAARSAANDASIIDLMFDKETDDLYERIEVEISGIDPHAEHSSGGSDGGRSLSKTNSLAKKQKSKKKSPKAAARLQGAARKLGRAEKSVLEARQAQRDKERAASTMLRMVNEVIPAHFDERLASVLKLSKKETKLIKKMSRSSSTAASSATTSDTLKKDLSLLTSNNSASTTTASLKNTHNRSTLGARHQSTFTVDACQYSVGGVSSEKREWFRSGASIAQDGQQLHRRYITTDRTLLLQRASSSPNASNIHRPASMLALSAIDHHTVSKPDKATPRSHSAMGAPTSQRSPQQNKRGHSLASKSRGAVEQRNLAILNGIGGKRQVSPPSSPSSRSSARRSAAATPSRPTSPVDGSGGSEAGGGHEDAALPAALIPKNCDDDGDSPFDENGEVPLALAKAAPNSFLSAVDLLCYDHLDRQPTTMEYLHYLVQYVRCAEKVSSSSSPAEEVDAGVVLEHAVLAAAEYVDAIWYHLDGQSLQLNPTIARATAAKLRNRDPNHYTELSGIFSMSLVTEVVDRLAKSEGSSGHHHNSAAPNAQQTTATKLNDVPDVTNTAVQYVNEAHVADDVVPPQSAPQWAATDATPAQSHTTPHSESDETEGAAVAPEMNSTSEQGDTQQLIENQRDEPTVGDEPTPTAAAEAATLVSPDHEEGASESAAPAVATEADDPSPAAPTSQSQTTAVINSSTAIKTSTSSTVESNINFSEESPSQTAATTKAITTAGRLQKSNELIISEKCRKVIVAVEIALHEFISSISGVREFERSCDGVEDYYHSNGGVVRRHKQLPASMLKDAVIDCGVGAASSSSTPSAAVVPLEERFAGWANSRQLKPVTHDAEGHQRDNTTDATLHVYAVPIGSVPSLADAEQRTAHWTLGPLRKLFLELWLGTFSASLVVG